MIDSENDTTCRQALTKDKYIQDFDEANCSLYLAYQAIKDESSGLKELTLFKRAVKKLNLVFIRFDKKPKQLDLLFWYSFKLRQELYGANRSNTYKCICVCELKRCYENISEICASYRNVTPLFVNQKSSIGLIIQTIQGFSESKHITPS